MNAPTWVDLVSCPTCHGSTRRPLVHQTLRAIAPRAYRGKTTICLACKGSGKVEAWRVCLTCGNWKDSCTCKVEMREVKVQKIVTRVAAVAEPETKAAILAVTAGGEVPHPPRLRKRRRAKLTPASAPQANQACPFGLRGCELKAIDERFKFCPRCCYGELK